MATKTTITKTTTTKTLTKKTNDNGDNEDNDNEDNDGKDNEIFGQFHIFGTFTKNHHTDLSRLLGLVKTSLIKVTWGGYLHSIFILLASSS